MEQNPDTHNYLIKLVKELQTFWYFLATTGARGVSMSVFLTKIVQALSQVFLRYLCLKPQVYLGSLSVQVGAKNTLFFNPNQTLLLKHNINDI